MLPLKVLLRREDRLMLLRGDPALGFCLQRRPEFGRQHRPRKPAQPQRQVVQASQERLHHRSPALQHGQEILGGGFQELPLPDQLEDRAARDPLPVRCAISGSWAHR